MNEMTQRPDRSTGHHPRTRPRRRRSRMAQQSPLAPHRTRHRPAGRRQGQQHRTKSRNGPQDRRDVPPLRTGHHRSTTPAQVLAGTGREDNPRRTCPATVPARHQRAGKDILPGRARRRLARRGSFQSVGDWKEMQKK